MRTGKKEPSAGRAEGKAGAYRTCPESGGEGCRQAGGGGAAGGPRVPTQSRSRGCRRRSRTPWGGSADVTGGAARRRGEPRYVRPWPPLPGAAAPPPCLRERRQPPGFGRSPSEGSGGGRGAVENAYDVPPASVRSRASRRRKGKPAEGDNGSGLGPKPLA